MDTDTDKTEVKNTEESPVEGVKDDRIMSAEEINTVSPRKIFFNDKVTIDIYDGDTLKDTLTCYRNLFEIATIIRTLDESRTVTINVTEDPKYSDPPEEGKEIKPYTMFNIVKMPVKDALKELVSRIVPEPNCLFEFQRLCEYMSFMGTLRLAHVTLVFKGAQPAGFAFSASCSDHEPREYTTLYDTVKSQNTQYKESIKQSIPGIQFEDDTNIITHL